MPKILNLITLQEKLDKFWEEVLDKECLNIVDTRWSFQFILDDKVKNPKNDVTYYPPRCTVCKGWDESIKCVAHPRVLEDHHLYDHFEQKPFAQTGKRRRGTLAFVPLYKNRVKIACMDFDNPKAMEALYFVILPALDALGIDYILEHPVGEWEGQKAHLWTKFANLHVSKVRDFIERFLTANNLNYHDLDLELFPIHKRSYIRLPGGYHLKRECVYHISRKGNTGNDPEFILDQFNKAEKISEEFIDEFLEKNPKSDQKVDTGRIKSKYKYGFKFTPKNLPISDKAARGLPADMKLYGSNCQALNHIINSVYSKDKLLNQKEVHMDVKYLANLAMHNDIIHDSEEGEAWFINALNETRDRPDEEHNWWRPEDYRANPHYLISKCETYERDLGLCDGCEFKNYKYFSNPSQLRTGKQIKKTKLYSITPVSVDYVRSGSLTYVKQRVISLLDNGERKDILLASPRSAGKSYTSDEIAVEQANLGRNVLIAVPNAGLAMAHKERIEAAGQRAFVVMSHENLFKRNPNGTSRVGNNFNCPRNQEINNCVKLGLSAKTIQNKFCNGCPFFQDCPYPGQYSQSTLPKYNIVIIQHAHLSCRETMYNILEKSYDLLIVDEEFIGSLHKEYFISDEKISVLESQMDVISWIPRLLDWIDGNPTDKSISMTENQAEILKELYEEEDLSWDLPEFIGQYNSGVNYDKRLGLFVFYPLPNIPVRLLTDATPPEEMLEIVLDNPNIEVIGDDEVIDPTIVNPENEVVQILDGSTSKSALAKDDYALYYEWLEYIGDDITARYKGESILITLYKDEDPKAKGIKHNFATRAKEWLTRNYPHIFEDNEIIFGKLSVGTNDYDKCAAHYQLSGVHFNAKQLHLAAYKLRLIENYWNRINNRPTISNTYPWYVTETSSLETIYVPLCRFEIDPVEGPGYYQYEFDPVKPWEGLYAKRLVDRHLNIVNKLGAAKKEQAERIMRNSNKIKKRVVKADKEELAKQIVNKSVLTEELIGYLRRE